MVLEHQTPAHDELIGHVIAGKMEIREYLGGGFNGNVYRAQHLALDKPVDRLLPELLSIGWSNDASEQKRAASQASFNFRMVEVVMMILMPLLAVALAIPPKRSTSALGVFVSVVLVVAYHKVNQYGEDIAALGRMDPILALWGPFVVFAALILWMY